MKNCGPELSHIIAELFHIAWRILHTVERCHRWSLYLRKLRERSSANQLVFFLWLVKSLKNFWIIGLLITLRTVVFLLISSRISGLLDQLQIIWQLYLKCNRHLIGLGYPRCSTWCIKEYFQGLECRSSFKIKSYGIYLLYLVCGLISSFLSNRRLSVIDCSG